MSYSQNDEESCILTYFSSLPFPRAKKFLDIGAHDGIGYSNTRKLAEMGWGGTSVEPSPAAFCRLMDLYRRRDDIKLAHVAIVPEKASILNFSDSRGDFVSTFSPKHQAIWEAPGANGRPGVQFQSIYVAGVTMATLIETFPGPYPFVNLDVEGINFELFKELPLRALSVELACVEYQDKLKEIEALAATQGYTRYHITSENILLAVRR